MDSFSGANHLDWNAGEIVDSSVEVYVLLIFDIEKRRILFFEIRYNI